MPTAEARAAPRWWTVGALAAGAALALLTGLAGGLVRIGLVPPVGALATPAAQHGAIMVCGFFGFVIALERAAALQRPEGWAAPALAAAGTIVALAGAADEARFVWAAAALALVLAYSRVLLRERAAHTMVETAGALAWAGGCGLWLLGAQWDAVIAWWCSFLALTIAGERRELARFVPLRGSARRAYEAVLAVQVVALGLIAVLRLPGALLWWLSLGLLAAWLLRYDFATRRGIARTGWALHTARCLRLGYGWLALAALWGMVRAWHGAALAGPGPLHLLLLGFVFAMVFGHAPIVLPALLRRPIAAPSGNEFLPVLVMGGGVALRALGDLLAAPGPRMLAGAVQALAIVAFAITMLRRLAGGARG